MADEFEQAVLCSFDQSGVVDAALRRRAEAYLTGLRASAGVWRPCAERFAATSHVEVQFWCLQTLLTVRTRVLSRTRGSAARAHRRTAVNPARRLPRTPADVAAPPQVVQSSYDTLTEEERAQVRRAAPDARRTRTR